MVLMERPVYGNYPARPCVNWVAALRFSAELAFPTHRASGETRDPFDEIVLECALAAGADFIVSGDKRHFLSLGGFRNIPILSPEDFLRRLL